MNHKITLVTALAAATLTISAQSNMAPDFINPSPGSSIVITKMSNNGKWMVSETAVEQDGNIRPGGGVLINIDNPTMKYTLSHSSGLAGVGDVTDDGSLVVGECQMKPAYWLTATGEWTTLPLPAGFTTGRLNAVTPDGKYAVGIVNNGNEWVFSPVLYDLTTKQAIDLPNMPNIDMTNQDQGQNSLVEISPDGRYLVGMISQSYVMPTALCTYVYDRQTSTHKFIGFDAPATATGKWKAKVDGLVFVDEPTMSPNGEWVTGLAYMVKNSTGGEFGEEYNAAYRYNVPNDVFEVYDGQFDHDVAAFSITNDGVVLAATPAQNPYSSMIVRHGNYYYNLDQILKQIYNIDFESKTGFAVTGKPVCVSDDGLTIAMIPSTSDTYILRLKESLSNCCENIDMLGDYTISPASGSVFSQLRSVTLNFGHQVQLAGNATRITVTDNAGTNVKALRATVDGSRVTISFQTVNMASGREYTITVPAGMFNLAGDTSIKSREIKFTYTGRSEGAVNVVSVYPADGHAFARLDMSTNPVIVTFDAQVATAENAKGYFYRDSEGTDELVCELNLACAGNQMMAYPTAGQYLFKDLGYKVVIPVGSITDISGAGPNEELVYNYVGAYVREVPVDDRYLFQEDCSSTDNFLFYEGDHRTPAEVPASWGFTADSHPWWVARDEDSTDMALASHSMYIPAGQSDDWVSTPQLYISDDKCVLTFDSQSYLKDKQDYLKVYLLATDDIFSALSASTVERFRKEGTVIYNELQSPGAKEEELAGDWRHNVVSLAEFAGKNVYIAFVNENNDQSAVFIDNIEVIHDTKYVLSFENAERLVNKESVTIKGIIDITSEIETFTTLSLTLKDADGKTVDTISETGLNLKKGDSYKFSFAKDLPLKSGAENKFTIELKLDDETANIMSSVKNLTFEPMQKVVLEEFTGQACPNCPRGIVAIDNLHRIYGDKFIPIALHCYTGDELGTGLHAHANFLGLVGAPSGTVNRTGTTSPMLVVDNKWTFSAGATGNNLDDLSWLDMAQREFEKQADAQITIASTFNDDTREFSLDCTVKSAISLTGQNINLMTVVTEDDVLTYQVNNNHADDNPLLGEWGQGGKYGSSTVYPYYAQHVARAYYGQTFNGTGGLIPQAIESGKDYTTTITGTLPTTVNVPDNCHIIVMMIDGNSNKVINADQVSLTGRSGIESVTANKQAAKVMTAGHKVIVSAEGDLTAEVYNLAGNLVGSASGTDLVEVDADGVNGVAIVRVSSAAGISVTKTIIR